MEALRRENSALQAQIAWLKQKVFGGAKSEKLDQAQLLSYLEELEKLVAKVFSSSPFSSSFSRFASLMPIMPNSRFHRWKVSSEMSRFLQTAMMLRPL